MNKPKEGIPGKIYNIKPKQFLGLTTFIFTISIIFDICPQEYWTPWLQDIFTYKISDVIPIILVVWTFTSALISFYLGKKEDKCYGIRLIDILRLEHSSTEWFQIVLLFFSEIVLLTTAAIGEWEITIVISAIVQSLTMGYVFCMICYATSEHIVLQEIEKNMQRTKKHYGHICQIRYSKLKGFQNNRFNLYSFWKNMELDKLNYKDILLIKMIQNTNYARSDETDKLFDTLIQYNRNNEWKSVIADTDAQQLCAEFMDRKICKHLTTCILETSERNAVALNIIRSWFMDQYSSLEMKKGILTALMEYPISDNLELCHRILKIEKNFRSELYLWCIIYHVFLKSYEGEGWRGIYAKQLIKERREAWTRENQEKALIFWKQNQFDRECLSANSYHELFKIIF